jgi:hypothetical protein
MTTTTINSIRVKPRWPVAPVSSVRFTCLSFVAEEILKSGLDKTGWTFFRFYGSNEQDRASREFAAAQLASYHI